MSRGSEHGNRERHPFAMALDWFRGKGPHESGSDVSAAAVADLPTGDASVVDQSMLSVAAATDPGCVRELNEDAYHVAQEDDASGESCLLAVVCDGMGGHAAGEIASRIAVETIAREGRAFADPVESLRRSIAMANRAILVASAMKREFAGMGTTVVAVIIRGGMAWCAHVGDSRCYLQRNGQLFLMTEDHSAVMDLVRRGELTATEARHHPDKNVISRALGVRREVDATVWPRPFRLQEGDQFLLCSDGLYDVVEDDEICSILTGAAPEAACQQLIAAARARGAPDNVTAVIITAATADAEAIPLRVTRESDVMEPANRRATEEFA